MTADSTTLDAGPVRRLRPGLWLLPVAFLVFPFVISILVDGQGPGAVLGNELGNARFLQGLIIEIFILAIFALSYDLVLGVTGILSFGHAMFFASGAYVFGIMLKTHGLSWPVALLVVFLVALAEAALFAVVLPRVHGITYALVTLGFASVFWIVIQSSDLADWAGAEVGLQGVEPPASYLDTTNNRFVFYLVVLGLLTATYLLYRRIVDSPAGKVFVAIRDNEDRARMLGYHTFWFKFLALVVASMTAGLAGVLHTIHQPIVTPRIASLGWMVTVLLIILIGGLGTITGALIGAAVYRLLEFYLDRWFGGSAGLLLGITYVLIVMYLPYGIVGTWRAKARRVDQGRERLARILSGRSSSP